MGVDVTIAVSMGPVVIVGVAITVVEGMGVAGGWMQLYVTGCACGYMIDCGYGPPV